jgi:hypothetical protein
MSLCGNLKQFQIGLDLEILPYLGKKVKGGKAGRKRLVLYESGT